MSFIGCVGSLMAKSGLVQLLKSAFGGVEKMLTGKKFPQNFRELHLVAEELLRDIFKEDISKYNDLISTLEDVGWSSRTAKLWLDVVIKPVFIMMKIVRAAWEADWPLHLVALKAMPPYFATAGHWNYLRYDLSYLIKMSQLLPDLMKKFLSSEHATCH